MNAGASLQLLASLLITFEKHKRHRVPELRIGQTGIDLEDALVARQRLSRASARA
jgi:hypothetical protein